MEAGTTYWKGEEEIFWGARHAHYLDCGKGLTGPDIEKTYQTIYLKYVHFMSIKTH